MITPAAIEIYKPEGTTMGRNDGNNPIKLLHPALTFVGKAIGFAFVCGMAWHAHLSAMDEIKAGNQKLDAMRIEMESLRTDNIAKGEKIIRLQTDLEWIKRKLQELEAKKVVGRIDQEAPVAGELLVERDQ